MKSIHQYTCTAHSAPDSAPSHPQFESVALPGLPGLDLNMSRILFKASVVI